MQVNKIGKYNLKQPLYLRIFADGDLIIADCSLLGLWGEGKTIKKAIKSFINYFIYDYKSYKNTPPEKLDYYAKKQLQLYEKLI